MGRKITIRESVAVSIAQVALFIESKGMIATAEKFSDSAYDFIEALANEKLIHNVCKEPVTKMRLKLSLRNSCHLN
jgi:hypothetical protein